MASGIFEQDNYDSYIDPQTLACKRLIEAILSQAAVDACAEPFETQRGLEPNPIALNALWFWHGSVVKIYLELIGMTAEDFLSRLYTTMQSKAIRTYTPRGLSEMNRRNYRWNLSYWEANKDWANKDVNFDNEGDESFYEDKNNDNN